MKILLVTYHPLINVNGGTSMYRKLILSFSTTELKWVSTGGYKKRRLIDGLTEYLVTEVNSIFFTDFFQRLLVRFPFNIFYYLYYYFFYPRLIIKTLNDLDLLKFDIVWIEHVKHNVIIANYLIKSGHKVHLSTNDFYSVNSKYFEHNFILKNIFKWNLENAMSQDFISDAMIEYCYEHNYKIKNYIKLWLNQEVSGFNSATLNKDRINILFYGNPHCTKNIREFSKYCTNSKSISLKIFGPSYLRKYVDESNVINVHGFIGFNELVSHIELSNFVYVPYSFDKKDRVVVSTSLPSKLIAALQIGTPIIAHCPPYSSLASLVKKFNLGIVIETLDIPESILDIEFLGSYDSWKVNCRNYYAINLKPDCQIEKFKSHLTYKFLKDD